MELGAWGFIYNTETQEFRVMSSPLYRYGAAYAVNNQGIAVGWVEDMQTDARMPSIFMPDGSIVIIDPSEGVAGAINNEGKVVGSADGEAFIYDMNTTAIETFEALKELLSLLLAVSQIMVSLLVLLLMVCLPDCPLFTILKPTLHLFC